MTYGPVDFIALEMGTEQLKGEAMAALLELVEKKIIRLVDLVVVVKDADGNYEALEMQELKPDLIAILDPLDVEVTGMVQMEDIEEIAGALENNKTAAILLIENLWAIEFAEAVSRADGRLIMYDRIPFEVVNEMMEMFAEEEGE